MTDVFKSKEGTTLEFRGDGRGNETFTIDFHDDGIFVTAVDGGTFDFADVEFNREKAVALRDWLNEMLEK